MRTVSLALAAFALAISHVTAAEMNMRVFQINDHLISFYDGRPAQAPRPPNTHNWADYGALDVGVSTYVIRRGDQALVYDTFPTAQEAKWVRDYLTKAGVKHFTLVNSHWHLDHVGGNAIYADVDRIATDKTIQLLSANKAAIEAGTEWGPPVIKPLVVPDIGITGNTNYYVGDVKVELRPVNIHSEDGLVIYLPGDRILLAGDTLEDTVTFISEPENVVAQYNNMRKLKQWDIDRIFPNHGNPDVISHGGYQTTLIDATLDYLRKVITRAHDPDYLQGTLEDYVGDSVSKGWVSIWWAYYEPHKANLSKVSQALRNKPLPDLPE
ncbi:MAG TPA: MBL fold metallo-hydrolase [Steroidobacteraceae bacterium]|nr:MBL fold metallo-hydrolase [Steroidobacteraceae bacterium]